MLNQSLRVPSDQPDDGCTTTPGAPDFLAHLQQRLGLDELTAAEKLQLWLAAYQPGPAALQRAGGVAHETKTRAA